MHWNGSYARNKKGFVPFLTFSEHKWYYKGLVMCEVDLRLRIHVIMPNAQPVFPPIQQADCYMVETLAVLNDEGHTRQQEQSLPPSQ